MRRLTAEALGEDLAGRFLDPEGCRGAAALLADRPRPDPIGCCEIAFARAAVLKFLADETLPPPIAARAHTGIDAVVSRMFDGAHTRQTAAWYGPADLRTAAAAGVEHYRASAFLSDRLARTLSERLASAGPSSAVADNFTTLAEQAVVWITKWTVR
jgi:hypothetical protein